MWQLAEAVLALFGILIAATLVVGFCEGFCEARRAHRTARRLVNQLWVQGQLERWWELESPEEVED